MNKKLIFNFNQNGGDEIFLYDGNHIRVFSNVEEINDYKSQLQKIYCEIKNGCACNRECIECKDIENDDYHYNGGLITKEEIDEQFIGTNFGSMSNFDVVKYGLLKCACGYYQGKTSTNILENLGLITKKYGLTRKGKYHLSEYFRGNNNL